MLGVSCWLVACGRGAEPASPEQMRAGPGEGVGARDPVADVAASEPVVDLAGSDAGGFAVVVEEPEMGPEVDALVARAVAAVAGGAEVDEVLTDPVYLRVHAVASFRAAIRERARGMRVTLVTADEPGPRALVEGRLRDARGEPLVGALVYVYQTDARGWYGAKGPHFVGPSGDERHARLFGYLRTDAQGRYALSTIRPSGYPRTDLPAHIHIEVFVGDEMVLISEVLFADDPRLTPAQRERGLRDGFVVAAPEAMAGGVTRYVADFTLRAR